MSSNKTVAKNALMLYFRMGVTMIASLITSRVVLKELGFVDFGIYNVVGGIVTIFATITSAMSGSTSRFITLELNKETDAQPTKVFSTAAILHILLALLIVAGCETIGLWFLNCKLDIPADKLYAANWVFQFSVIASAIGFTQVPYTAAMIAHERMGIFAYIGLFTAFGNLSVAYLIAFNPFNRLIWYALLILIVNMLSLIISRLYCIRQFAECRIHAQKDKALYKEMLRFGCYDLLGNISILAQGQGLNMVLNMFYGPVMNAAQGIAVRIQTMVTQFSSNFTTALRPQIYRLYANNRHDELMSMVMKGALLTYMLLIALAIPICTNIHEILHLWLENYPPYTASFSILVVINTIVLSYTTTRVMVFHATGNIKAYSLTSGFLMTLALPIGYVLLRSGYSPNSIYIGMIFTTLMSDINTLLLLRRYVKYSVMEFLRKVQFHCVVCTVLALGAAIAVKLIADNLHPIGVMCLTSIASWAVIGCYMWLFILSENQKHEIISKIMPKRLCS